MIVFDLACKDGHVFEIWFGSSDDYASQKARGLIACPYCGATDVDKAVMAPRVAAKGNRMDVAPAVGANVPVLSAPVLPEGFKEAMRALAAAQSKALEHSEHVGDRFVDEARAMHLGETELRSIHGQASPAEAKALIEEGVAVAPLPFPVVPPERRN
jgi:hypothetical protein